MREITFACQPSFEKYARKSRREESLRRDCALLIRQACNSLDSLTKKLYLRILDGMAN
jgi:hypothetical protein